MSSENSIALAVAPREGGPASKHDWWRSKLYPVVALVIIAVFWEFASGSLFNQYFLSKPSIIFDELVESFATGQLVQDILFTLNGTAIAFLIAAATGVATAAVFAGYNRVATVLNPYLTFLYVLPKIALAPVIFIWLGIGAPTQITIGAITAFFFVFYSSYHGMRGVSPALMNTVAILGATRMQIVTRVLIQGAAPHIAQGLRLGAIYAFHGAVVGEMVASNQGLGYAIIFASTRSSSAGVLAHLVVLGAIAYLFTQLIEYLFRHMDPAARARKAQ